MTKPATSRISELTWDVVRDRLSAGAIPVLPIGASCKQHGLHLPLETDAIQAEWFAAKIAERLDALIWPTLGYGYYPAFVAYPGSVSIDAQVFTAITTQIIVSLLAVTSGPVLVINTGISTGPGLYQAIESSGAPDRVRRFSPYLGPEFLRVRAAMSQQRYGSHADEVETSVMLVIAPQRVDLSRAQASPGSDNAPGPLTPTDPGSATFSPSGSWAIRRWRRAQKVTLSSPPCCVTSTPYVPASPGTPSCVAPFPAAGSPASATQTRVDTARTRRSTSPRETAAGA